MEHGTTVQCPHCGTRTTLGITLTNVSFQGAARNIGVTCPRCEREYDAAPGDGTYSTVGGQLQLVARDLISARPEELSRMEQDLRAAAAADSRDQAEAVLERRPGLRPVLELWRPTTHDEFWRLIKYMVKVIGILAAGGYAASQGEDIVTSVVDQVLQGP